MRNMKENYSVISEQAKLIRENVDYLCQQQNAKTILITSGESGTGKSTLSANLAVAYAQKGDRTLLIDADLRKPTQHHLFTQEMQIGLSSYILRKISIENCVQQVVLDNCAFSIVTSGALVPNPNDLLASPKMSAALQEVKQMYDVIIIDTPPINIVSDALILAKKVDGVLLVIHADKTNKQSAKNAVQKLRLVNANLLGVVVNGTDKAENYYY